VNPDVNARGPSVSAATPAPRTTAAEKDGPAIAVRGPTITRPTVALLSRPALAMLLVAALLAILERWPTLEFWRTDGAPPPEAPPMAAASASVGEARLDAPTEDRPELAQPEQVELPRSRRGPIARTETPELAIDVQAPPVPITDPGGVGLRGFYEALARTSRREAGAITRVAHFGVTRSSPATTSPERSAGSSSGTSATPVMASCSWPTHGRPTSTTTSTGSPRAGGW
jgi:hypothetical protein